MLLCSLKLSGSSASAIKSCVYKVFSLILAFSLIPHSWILPVLDKGKFYKALCLHSHVSIHFCFTILLPWLVRWPFPVSSFPTGKQDTSAVCFWILIPSISSIYHSPELPTPRERAQVLSKAEVKNAEYLCFKTREKAGTHQNTRHV